MPAARRLRFHHPGHGRDHGPDRRAGRRAAEDRRRLRRHLHRRLCRRPRSWPRCAGATRPAPGCHIDMALLDVQVAVLANQAMNYLVGGEAPHRLGNAHPNIAPYQTFAVADGHVIVAVGNDGQFGRLCALLGLGRRDARFATNADRVAQPGGADRRCSRRRSRCAAATSCSPRSPRPAFPAGPINDVAEVFADPQVVARGLRIDAGGIPGVASPIVIDGTTAGRRPAEPAWPARHCAETINTRVQPLARRSSACISEPLRNPETSGGGMIPMKAFVALAFLSLCWRRRPSRRQRDRRQRPTDAGRRRPDAPERQRHSGDQSAQWRAPHLPPDRMRRRGQPDGHAAGSAGPPTQWRDVAARLALS